VAGATTAIYEPISRKNVLINGDMRVSQRATFETFPAAADNTYTTVDRWKTLMSAHFNPYPSTAYAPTAGNGSAYALGAVSSGTGSKWGYIQILEAADVYALRGQSVSVQAKIKATAGLSDIRMALVSWTGTADGATADPISAWNSAGTNPTLIADWAYINTPANLSVLTTYATYKLENQTVPTGATNLAVFIWSDDTTHTASADFFFFTDVQLEVGTICTEFERRPYTEELALCQRYYFKTFREGTAPAQNTAVYNGAVHYVNWIAGVFTTSQQLRFPQVMRTAPTLTYYNPGAANNKWRNATVGADSGTPSALRTSAKALSIINVQVAGDTVSSEICVHVTADAEL